MRLRLPDWLRFVGLPLVALAVVIAVTMSLHRDLEQVEAEQIARIAESESYAARSRLVRSVNGLLGELQDLHAYWSENAHLPREFWSLPDNVTLSDYDGIDLVLWWDAGRDIRLLHDAEHPWLGHVPADEDWRPHSGLLETARQLETDTLRGPFRDSEGRHHFLVWMMPDRSGVGGTLIARVDAGRLLGRLLADDSPGYAIAVDWDDQRIYERGTPGSGQPGTWTRSGQIRNDLGAVWTVTHAPTPALVASLTSRAIDMVRIAGLLIAILMVVLLIETGRATRKARLATRAERTIAALNRELEAKVRQRTREVAERSQDLLTITDSVGHDLRNPLNAISANLQLLELKCSEVLDDEGHELLRQTGASLSSTTEILDRLLELSSVFNDRFTAEPIDMQKMVRDIFDELRQRDPVPPAELIMDELPEAHGERILVRTLLTNLLGNAFKYSRGEKLRRITVRARRNGDEVVYSISDNGVGFDDAEAQRMFKAYERLDGNTEGLGLGLDIAARAVLRHRGRIWATGEPGVGASFYFTLSAAPASG